MFYDTKNKYDILYKDLNIEKNSRNNILILIFLLVGFVINAINIIYLTSR